MKLLNLNKYLIILIYFTTLFSSSFAEDSVDIWKKKDLSQDGTENATTPTVENNKNNISILPSDSISENILISESKDVENSRPLFGIYDPEENNFNLNMWSKTDGNNIKTIFGRINKISLSNSAEDLFINTIMTYSYLPQKNMSDDEFLRLKIDWLIKNKKDKHLEVFLNKNKDFKYKEKIIQYLVDKNIAKANLKEGCKKSDFISKEIKDSYLEKFKIYCLIFNDKKNEAQLLFDILKEQKLSDNFFNEKINFLLGITDKTSKKIRDDNLLNFYLSSITISDFKYEPTEKTNKFIWEYLNAANLIKVDDIENKDKIKNLELAANNNSLNKEKIFEIYKRIPFDLNSLINADGIYQSLDGIESRALIYQKYLLSDNIENQIKLLLLLKELFKKDNLSNIYAEFLSNQLKAMDEKKIPSNYKNIVEKNIFTKEEYKLGKIKYDDKVLHRSRIIRYYTEDGTPKQKAQKNFNSVFKKIKKNRKYFYSAKDLALIESLETDGFLIPKEIGHSEIAKDYPIPQGLLSLMKNQEIGLLALKFVEIIGEDEISDLDPETVYFITHILNKAKLTKFRDQVLITALPLRT
tara:strand:- start:504 stop:2249 length:1746 start_codon:yes stop_codon:yes gene_type:complete